MSFYPVPVDIRMHRYENILSKQNESELPPPFVVAMIHSSHPAAHFSAAKVEIFHLAQPSMSPLRIQRSTTSISALTLASQGHIAPIALSRPVG